VPSPLWKLSSRTAALQHAAKSPSTSRSPPGKRERHGRGGLQSYVINGLLRKLCYVGPVYCPNAWHVEGALSAVVPFHISISGGPLSALRPLNFRLIPHAWIRLHPYDPQQLSAETPSNKSWSLQAMTNR